MGLSVQEVYSYQLKSKESITVDNKESLKIAKKEGYRHIIVKGKLANDLVVASKISRLSKVAVGTLAAAVTATIAAVPFTGGASAPAGFVGVVAPMAATSGISTSVIIAALSVGGLLLAYAIFKDYNIEITHKSSDGTATEVKLNKKQ